MEEARHRMSVLGGQVAPDACISTSPTAGLDGGDVAEFSITLPEKLSDAGPWNVHRSAASPYQLIESFAAPDHNVHTMYDNWRTSCERYSTMPFLGTRQRDAAGKLGEYTWMTYGQAADVAKCIGSGMLELGMTPGQFIGIYSINTREWMLMDAAIHSYSMTSVPLYDTLGPDAVEYITNHAGLTAVACTANVLATMLTALPKCPTVQLVIVLGGPAGQMFESAAGGCKVMSLEQVVALGRRHPKAAIPPKQTDIATLCYTSGTTGTPKGAVLLHRGMIACAAAVAAQLPNFNAGDRHMSYLPLAHIFERGNCVMAVHMGAAIGFYSGNVVDLLDDVVALKPCFFPSVPRLWNRIHDRVMTAVRESNPVSRALFARAFAYKRAAYERGDATGGRWGPFYDKYVFAKMRAKLGGEIKYMITGSAPIATEVLMFLRICFGATVLEGYGMTETSCAATIGTIGDMSVGHVGAPLRCNEIKLIDIPEMNYFSTDKPLPRGEVCLRGPNMFVGYYKDEANTRESLDQDNWLHTGDVGAWLPSGNLKIIDRKKNIFKLSQGEYVAPEKIENIYTRSPMVMQSFVYGDSLKSQLVGVAMPDPEVLLPWAKQNNIQGDLAALCANPVAVAAVLKSMLEQGRIAKLNGYEQVVALKLVSVPFSVENGLLTPSFKLKRPQAKALYQADIDAMYAKIPSS